MSKWLIILAVVLGGYWAWVEYGPAGGQGVRLQSGGVGGAGVASLRRSTGRAADSIVGAGGAIGN